MNLDSYLGNLEAQKEAMVDRIMQWSNINSGTYNVPGLERMATLLTQAFSVLECEGNVLSLFPLEQLDMHGNTKTTDLGPMLRFWKRPEAPVQVLLVGHMDTVFGLDHPFQAAIRKSEQIIKGPGVADMKGGVCIMLEALKIFEQSPNPEKLGWEVIINPDEEIGSLASASFLEERAKHHQVGLLFEPAMDEKGTLVSERKGSGKFTIVVHGIAAHAGRDFQQGRNAINLLAEIILALNDLNGQREAVTLNLGLAQGGSAVNIVPDLALCFLDVRIKAAEDEKWVVDQLETIVAKANQREGYKVELKGQFTRKPKLLSEKNRILFDLLAEVGQQLNQTITWKSSGGCSDSNNLTAVGLPNIDGLGVCGGKIHSEEEYLLVDSLISRTKLVATLLLRLSEGKFKV
jgi:glutamate carboxypeptidase